MTDVNARAGSGRALIAMLALSACLWGATGSLNLLAKPVPKAKTASAAGQPAKAATSSLAGPGEVCPPGAKVAEELPRDIREQARPGQCYAQLLTAPVFETVTEKVEIAPARTETRKVKAVTEWREREVVVTPERRVREVVPEETQTVTETVILKPAGVKRETVEAVYETVEAREVVRPARQEWLRSETAPVDPYTIERRAVDPHATVSSGAASFGPAQAAPSANRPNQPGGDAQRAPAYRQNGFLTWPGKGTGGVVLETKGNGETVQGDPNAPHIVYRLVEHPAEERVVTRRVLRQPETVREVPVPAETRTITREVLVKPETVIEKVIPAVTRKERYEHVVTPAREETVTIPAVTRPVDKRRLVTPARKVWREILCSRNTRPETVQAIQTALAARGYDPGPVDGKLGAQTLQALQVFQANQGLPQGAVSVEAAEALGVKIR